MKRTALVAVALLATPVAAQAQENVVLYPDMQESVVKGIESAKTAAKKLSTKELRQVFKVERPVCHDAKELGSDYIDEVNAHLNLSLWQGLLLFNICLVKNYGTADQQATIISLMR